MHNPKNMPYILINIKHEMNCSKNISKQSLFKNGILIISSLLLASCSQNRGFTNLETDIDRMAIPFHVSEKDKRLIGLRSGKPPISKPKNTNPLKAKSADQTLNEIKQFSRLLSLKNSKDLATDDVVRGLEALVKNKYEEANFYLQHAIKFDPKNSHLHKLNALCYHFRGDKGDPQQYQLAEVGYTLAGRLDPGDSSIPYYLGLLNFTQNRLKTAQNYFAEAILLDDRKHEYYLGLAASSYYLGELDRAYKNITRASKMNPYDVDTIQASGMIHAAMGAFMWAERRGGQLAERSKVRHQYLQRRIEDWKNYYSANSLKTDTDFQFLMAQNLDIYGVPKGGMFDSTDPDNRDPMRPRDDSEGNITSLPNVTQNDVTESQSQLSKSNENAPRPQSPSDSQEKTVETNINSTKSSPTKKAKPKIKTPSMALVDVAIIRTEEIYRSSKGVNLLNGLNLFFTSDSIFTDTRRVRVAPSVNDSFTIKLGTDGAGLNYSLNIFNDNYDRNEVIARPTILVEDKKKSSFFSGGTMHIVLEGGVAGSGSVEPIDTGVTLEVEPNFLDSETINLSVLAKRTFLEAGLSQVTSKITGTTFAKTSKTTISANLTLKYGETMVLSGLSDQEKEIMDDKVPGLGQLPAVQYLFRNQTKLSYKKTVLVLLTPRRASLSHDNGESVDPEAGVTARNVRKLETKTEWMKPQPHLKAIVHHLGKYDFFNNYRRGDIALENWAGELNVWQSVRRALEYFYIKYDFEKHYTSEL